MDIEDEIINNFSSDKEGDINHINNNIINEESNLANIIYNPNIYNFNFIYTYFKEKGVFKSGIKCPVCNNLMSIYKDKSFFDGICFHYLQFNPKNDIKYSKRKYSIFENIKIKLIILYFKAYECLLINSSTKKTELEVKNFSANLSVEKPSKKSLLNYICFTESNKKLKCIKIDLKTI